MGVDEARQERPPREPLGAGAGNLSRRGDACDPSVRADLDGEIAPKRAIPPRQVGYEDPRYAFQTFPGSTATSAMALRVSTIRGAHWASSP